MNETIPIQRQAPARAERSPDAVERGLSVVSIAKSYDRKVVLSDVSVSVERGEVLGLLGPNGAGKTTCFYSIMGLVKPDSGRILLDGQDITGLPMYRRAILGWAICRRKRRSSAGSPWRRTSWRCSRSQSPTSRRGATGSSNYCPNSTSRSCATRPPPLCRAASGGAARSPAALAANPSIMLLDEPFAGIDPISISDIRSLIMELKTRDIGVLITDHNVRETLDIVDRACIIYGGQVLFAGSPEDLVRDENVRRLYLGESFEL
jgi:lipopolysaccharide export system ATP-binding protein